MKPNPQPDLPAMPPDFSQPVECRGHDLAATIRAATAAGFRSHRMVALPGARYRLEFYKTHYATTQNHTL